MKLSGTWSAWGLGVEHRGILSQMAQILSQCISMHAACSHHRMMSLDASSTTPLWPRSSTRGRAPRSTSATPTLKSRFAASRWASSRSSRPGTTPSWLVRFLDQWFFQAQHGEICGLVLKLATLPLSCIPCLC